MNNRTDLAIELEKTSRKNNSRAEKIGDTEVVFTVLTENNEYQKPKGTYITVKLRNINLLTDFSAVEKAIEKSLENLLIKAKKSVLVVGLGNREITSDCIGPYTAEKILATRHISEEFSKKIGLERLQKVSVITPSVLGKTGIESSEIVKAVVDKTKPDAVIVIDALCANTVENLFSVIQLCDSGISPGSGVKNTRKELSFATLGVPTVAIGVPTVVEASVLAKELSGKDAVNKLDLLLTPKDTDLLSHRISEILAHALNAFLQPYIDREVLFSLV